MRTPSRFAVHDLRGKAPRPNRRSRDWDYRFVMAVILLYGCVGAAFFAVEWMHATPDDKPPSLEELREWPAGPGGSNPIVRPPTLPRPAPGAAPAEGR